MEGLLVASNGTDKQRYRIIIDKLLVLRIPVKHIFNHDLNQLSHRLHQKTVNRVDLMAPTVI
jgi:hypothetical protein